ncbi:uncharacterized protein LAESUDRAFT_81719 [Laetiporus sulphureus 93-53]|uniref:Uncharacterized protein n=1 Tax=Laetiporus sulphureus 93-53 TaxID=1314785 RepID=A0A165F2D7_9APHY|nr:uncharacterized protein LAESUDRAFT_81719 [Laetiporus sulphureus 93-53]KZT08229.1 hypothetical protein LAESUDRAFT_81719 [Laetiporus sulphureus 93-53]
MRRRLVADFFISRSSRSHSYRARELQVCSTYLVVYLVLTNIHVRTHIAPVNSSARPLIARRLVPFVRKRPRLLLLSPAKWKAITGPELELELEDEAKRENGYELSWLQSLQSQDNAQTTAIPRKTHALSHTIPLHINHHLSSHRLSSISPSPPPDLPRTRSPVPSRPTQSRNNTTIVTIDATSCIPFHSTLASPCIYNNHEDTAQSC